MNHDYFFYDTERLHTIASAQLIKQGLTYFKEKRVISLGKENNRLIAQVEDTDDEMYWIELSADDHGRLAVSCDCQPFRSVCCHAIAVLYSYADQYGREDRSGLF